MSSSYVEFLRRRQLLGIERKRTSELAGTLSSALESERRRLFVIRSNTAPAPAVRQSNKEDNWAIPDPLKMSAWTIWRKLSCQAGFEQSPADAAGPLQFVIVVGGGIGDLLKSSQILPGLRGQFHCEITYVTQQPAAKELFANNPYVKSVLIADDDAYGIAKDCLSHIDVFDAVIVWKYATQYLFPPGSRLDEARIAAALRTGAAINLGYERYFASEAIWPLWNNGFSRELARAGLTVNALSIASAGLKGRTESDVITFFPILKDRWILRHFLGKRYITVHHGFDLKISPETIEKKSYVTTKNISIEKWSEIVETIRAAGIDVVQLGIAAEEKIPGVDYYFNGQTTLSETALLLKHAICHIDTEGGLVHLNRAVHGRSVVLFGPTPVKMFGYDQNINLEPKGCRACWFTTENWLLECPRNTAGPECMNEHTAANVAEAVNRLIGDLKTPQVGDIQFESMAPSAWTEHAGALLNELPPYGDAPRTLLVCDTKAYAELNSRARSVPRLEMLVVSDGVAGIAPGFTDSVDYASPLNFPRARDTFDRVIYLGEVLEDISAALTIKEALRVLAPGGRAIFITRRNSFGGQLYDDLDGLGVNCAGKAHRDEEKKSFISLRKIGLADAGLPNIPVGESAASPVSEAGDRETGDLSAELKGLERVNAAALEAAYQQSKQLQETKNQCWAALSEQLQRLTRSGGWIHAAIDFAEGYGSHFFGLGWHDSDGWGCWSKDRTCELLLPVPDEACLNDRSWLEVHLEVGVVLAAKEEERSIVVSCADEPVGRIAMDKPNALARLQIPAQRFKDADPVRLIFEVDKVVRAPLGPEPDDRYLGFGVRRFRYRFFDPAKEGGKAVPVLGVTGEPPKDYKIGEGARRRGGRGKWRSLISAIKRTRGDAG